jgi:hypothetical protein
MRKLLLILFTLFIFSVVKAQNNFAKSDDFGRLSLTVYVPDQMNLTFEAKSMLENKLSQIVSKRGVSGNNTNQRFIITVNSNMLNKYITNTSPTQYVYELEIVFYIGDGIEGKKFYNVSQNVSGIGMSETKAFIDAFKNINTNDVIFDQLIEKGKQKIIEYYNGYCDIILKDAESIAYKNNIDEALYKLALIPDACKECFEKSRKLSVILYKQAQERECKTKVMQAKSIWINNSTVEGGREAANILNQIDPETSCFVNATNLINSINSTIQRKIDETISFERKYALIEQKNQNEIDRLRIQAVRDIAVSYFSHRPSTTIVYNVRSWWYY